MMNLNRIAELAENRLSVMKAIRTAVNEALDEAADQIPTTWLDPLLAKLIKNNASKIEALLRGVQDRIRALKP